MDTLPLHTNAADLPSSARSLPLRQLLGLLLSDVATDVEVVTRELGLRNEMLERLRRALDRLICAQSVLEAVGGRWAAGTLERGGNEGLDDAGSHENGAAGRVRDAVKLLAEVWPQDYPDGAVEWMLLRQVSGVGETAASRMKSRSAFARVC
ncbi:conserved hypothetical protein [Paraburkholderia caribensis]|nr:conserved hypothetical protein [Paraburkholderia caribensis]